MRLPFTGYEFKLSKREAIDPNIRPDDDRWYSPFLWSQNTASGMVVNEETAMKFAAVYACVKVLAETLASTPLMLYKRQGEGKERAATHPLYSKMRGLTCAGQRLTSMQFRMVMMVNFLLGGNAYAQKLPTNDGSLGDLAVMHPNRTTPRVDPDMGHIVYDYVLPNGTKKTLDFDEVIHIKSWSLDGLKGVSPITLHRETVGLGLAAESFGANFFRNSAAPAGVLQLGPDMNLSDQARARLKADFKKKYTGTSNAGEVAILEEGVEWKPIGMSGRDAQYIDQRKFQKNEICSIFRVPPHMIADLERSTNNNIEHQGIEFVVYSMLPHYTLWEEVLSRDLLDGSSRLFFEFLVSGLTRGDLPTRSQAYATGRQWGWLSINDIRRMENLNDIGDAGDVYLSPLNMVNAEAMTDPEFGIADTNATPAKDPVKDPVEDPAKDDKTKSAPKKDKKSEAEAILADVLTRKNDQKTAEIAEKEPEKPVSPEIFLREQQFLLARSSQAAAMGDLIGRILRKEEATIIAALKSPFKRDKIDSLYADLPGFITSSLRNAVVGYIEQVRLCAKLSRCGSIRDDQVYPLADKILDDLIKENFSRREESRKGHDELSTHMACGLINKVEQHTLNM